MNPNPAPAPTPTLYGFPCPMWILPARALPPLIRTLYAEAYEVLTEPASRTARLWAAEIEEDGYRALTHCLTLPQVLSLVSELPDAVIVRLTGIAPSDKSRQEVVRALYAPAEI